MLTKRSNAVLVPITCFFCLACYTCTDKAATAIVICTHPDSCAACLVHADVLIGFCAHFAQVQAEADLDVDFLFVDVDGVLPELYPIVEVVFMGNSLDGINSNGEQLEPESVLLLPVLLFILLSCC